MVVVTLLEGKLKRKPQVDRQPLALYQYFRATRRLCSSGHKTAYLLASKEKKKKNHRK